MNDTDGRGVASGCRDPRFDSQHRQKFTNLSANISISLCMKDKSKEKESKIGPFSPKEKKMNAHYFAKKNLLNLKKMKQFQMQAAHAQTHPQKEIKVQI